MSDGNPFAYDPDKEEDKAKQYSNLDRAIGMAVRYADELGFHFCSACISTFADTNVLMLRIGVGMFTANRTTVRASGAIELGGSGGTSDQLRRHLVAAKRAIGEVIAKDGLDLEQHPYAHLRKPWEESLQFGPEFVFEDETGELRECLE